MTTSGPVAGRAVAALLLSGGSSRRMGRDKTQLVLEGMTIARRTGRLLQQVSETALEVGPGTSGLAFVREVPHGAGPLAAVAEGRRALLERGHCGDALVVACDLPLLSADLLHWLAAFDAPISVVPVVEGRAQPLLARWSGPDLDTAAELVRGGERSLRPLLCAPGVVLVDESQWGSITGRETFDDIDTPADAHRYGLDV